MTRPFAAVLMLLVCGGMSAVASAQVAYEPVQYQFTTPTGRTFYYGGHDPRMFDFAMRDAMRTSYSSVTNSIHVVDRGYVYSDALPYVNQADSTYTTYSSYTSADARNDAYHAVPRYFRKRDLLRAAVPVEDGSWVVPAQAQPYMDMHVLRPFKGATMGPAVPKGTILIIPKEFLEPPAKQDARQVAMAQQ
jgi:hypothetical protein